MQDLATLSAAFDTGRRDAIALAVGDTFTGAYGGAESHGLKHGDTDFRFYVSGFLYGLEESGKKNRILVDRATSRILGFAEERRIPRTYR